MSRNSCDVKDGVEKRREGKRNTKIPDQNSRNDPGIRNRASVDRLKRKSTAKHKVIHSSDMVVDVNKSNTVKVSNRGKLKTSQLKTRQRTFKSQSCEIKKRNHSRSKHVKVSDESDDEDSDVETQDVGKSSSQILEEDKDLSEIVTKDTEKITLIGKNTKMANRKRAKRNDSSKVTESSIHVVRAERRASKRVSDRETKSNSNSKRVKVSDESSNDRSDFVDEDTESSSNDSSQENTDDFIEAAHSGTDKIKVTEKNRKMANRKRAKRNESSKVTESSIHVVHAERRASKRVLDRETKSNSNSKRVKVSDESSNDRSDFVDEDKESNSNDSSQENTDDFIEAAHSGTDKIEVTEINRKNDGRKLNNKQCVKSHTIESDSSVLHPRQRTCKRGSISKMNTNSLSSRKSRTLLKNKRQMPIKTGFVEDNSKNGKPKQTEPLDASDEDSSDFLEVETTIKSIDLETLQTENDSTEDAHVGDKRKNTRKNTKKVNKKQRNHQSFKCEKTDKDRILPILVDNSTKDSLAPSLNKVDTTDVTAVLLSMEGSLLQSTSAASFPKSTSNPSASSSGSWEDIDSDDDEDNDWEEVEADNAASSSTSQIPNKPVEITLDLPALYKKREKKAFDWKSHFKRMMNRFNKELRTNIHKVHLLCLLANGLYRNRVCNNELLQAQCLSLIPREYTNLSAKGFNLNTLGKLLHWYKDLVSLNTSLDQIQKKSLISSVQACVEAQTCEKVEEYITIFIIILRLLGLEVRLVLSLQPVPLNLSKDTEKVKKKKSHSVKKDSDTEINNDDVEPASSKGNGKKIKKANSKKPSNSKYFDEPLPTGEKIKKKEEVKNLFDGKKNKGKMDNSSQKEVKSKHCSAEKKPVMKKTKGRDTLAEKEDESASRKSRRKRNVDVTYEEKLSDDDGDESEGSSTEFEEEVKYRSPPVKKEKKKLPPRKVQDSPGDKDSSYESDTAPSDMWLEVYLESEKRWISVDCVQSVVDKPLMFERFASKPIAYVLGFKNDNSVKDLTSRYASEWLTHTKKYRVNSDWWKTTLSDYKSNATDMEELENENMKEQLLTQPLPTSVGKFKSHPLYVLQRHLLKYEAIYPETSAPLGFLKTEPIYARECVHVLHSRENWLKEGLTVKMGETAYKMVKSNAKRNRRRENSDRLDLELFGKWQTELYVSPPVVNGIVPRNPYGNVDFYLPSMLPAGAVHLKGLPGLNRIARKMKLDVAAAMVGWDVHSGFSHPVFDGWIVPEENKDILLAAWDEDQELQQEREAEKREKRVFKNWKTLIKGVLIKEKLKTKYKIEDETPEAKQPEVKKEPETKKKKKNKSGSEVINTDCSWPLNRMKEKNVKDNTTFHMEEM